MSVPPLGIDDRAHGQRSCTVSSTAARKAGSSCSMARPRKGGPRRSTSPPESLLSTRSRALADARCGALLDRAPEASRRAEELYGRISGGYSRVTAGTVAEADRTARVRNRRSNRIKLLSRLLLLLKTVGHGVSARASRRTTRPQLLVVRCDARIRRAPHLGRRWRRRHPGEAPGNAGISIPGGGSVSESPWTRRVRRSLNRLTLPRTAGGTVEHARTSPRCGVCMLRTK